MDLAKVEGFFH